MEKEVALYEMLDARERRAAKQAELLSRFASTLVCFTMNIAGPIKNSPLIEEGYSLGKSMLKGRLAAAKVAILHFEETIGKTGCEAFFVVDADAQRVQLLTSEIEDGSQLGRLFDMDVLTADGRKTGRAELGLPERKCLICGGAAKGCARSRAHTVAELQAKTSSILEESVRRADARDAARLACRALLYEVGTTPKPGLVDRANRGSHKDMDFFTFADSTAALFPYFAECARIGRENRAAPAPDTFKALREAGKKAEAAMFAATRGVNTHKGAIFSLGILCAAMGRLGRPCWDNSDALLDECAAVSKGITRADFADLSEENAVTTGQKLYVRYGITGVRGEAEAGFPSVRKAGLPVLREGIRRGMPLNDAGCAALLAIIANSTDTNIIARSDRETQLETASELKEMLSENPYPDRAALEELDKRFIAANLSPGGSADMLSICYLLHFLERGD